jgi:hypothetical protein
VDIIATGRKGRHLNILEKYIYRISKDNLHMNDTYISTTPYLRHYISRMADSSTQIPSKGVKAVAIAQNSHNNK